MASARTWTPAMRKAQARRMRARWREGKLERPRASVSASAATVGITPPATMDGELSNLSTVLRAYDRLSPAGKAYLKARLG